MNVDFQAGEIINLFEDLVSKISPSEFEKFCFTVIKEFAKAEKLNEFEIIHNKKVKINDESYQIDVYVEFTAMKVKFKVIIECKHQKRPVGRNEVVILNDKIHHLSAHKGILISSSGFQRGAIERATESGIALIQIIDKSIMFIRASIPTDNEMRLIEYMEQCPPYYALYYSGNIPYFPDKKIFPPEKPVC